MATVIAYALTPQLVAEGYAAATERAYGKIASSRGYLGQLRNGLVAAVAIVMLFVIKWAVEHVIGETLNITALLVGLAYGTSFLMLLWGWRLVLLRTRSPFKLNGPTLAPIVAALEDDQFVMTGPNFQYRYDWSAIEDVTLGRTVMLLWIEPGGALVIPRAAFADASAEAAIVAEIKAKIASATAS